MHLRYSSAPLVYIQYIGKEQGRRGLTIHVLFLATDTYGLENKPLYLILNFLAQLLKMAITALRTLTRFAGTWRPWLLDVDSRLFSITSSSFNDEVEKAKTAASTPHTDTVFSKILKKEIPADIVHEDNKVPSHSCRC